MRDVEKFLAHFGVKGMKWGVIRKNYLADRNRELMPLTSFTTAKGDTVSLKEVGNPRFSSALAAVSSKFRNYIAGAKGFDILVDGKVVGEAAFKEKSKEEINLAWITVHDEHRGKGYATKVFDAGVAYAKAQGYKKITLEVPGNAPDARHIYEKFGFKDDVGSKVDTDDVWGGLYPMTYNIPQKRSRS